MNLTEQIIWLSVMALPIACISWTVTHEEIFSEPRAYFVERSKKGKWLITRKLFYMLTCEYCFSHYVTLAFIGLTQFKLLMSNWTGYIVAGFALVWIANIYMSLYNIIRIDLKKETFKTMLEEKEVEKMD